jgi:hypothetical protein
MEEDRSWTDSQVEEYCRTCFFNGVQTGFCIALTIGAILFVMMGG